MMRSDKGQNTALLGYDGQPVRIAKQCRVTITNGGTTCAPGAGTVRWKARYICGYSGFTEWYVDRNGCGGAFEPDAPDEPPTTEQANQNACTITCCRTENQEGNPPALPRCFGNCGWQGDGQGGWTMTVDGCNTTTTTTTTTSTTPDPACTTTTLGPGTTTTSHPTCREPTVPCTTTSTTPGPGTTTTTTTTQAPCVCNPPQYCSTVAGECTRTFCVPSTLGTMPPVSCSTTTSTTCDPAGTTTTCPGGGGAGGGSGNCTGCSFACNPDGEWVIVENNCNPANGCLCVPLSGPCDPCGEGVNVGCQTITVTTPPPGGVGPDGPNCNLPFDCRFVCLSVAGGNVWFPLDVGLCCPVTADQDCADCCCLPPSTAPGDCTCGQIAFGICRPCSGSGGGAGGGGGGGTTPNPCSGNPWGPGPIPCAFTTTSTSTSSTTTTTGCSGACKWLGDGSSGWIENESNCSDDCPCNIPPPYESVCSTETAYTPCGTTTSTSTTTTTTTTTTAFYCCNTSNGFCQNVASCDDCPAGANWSCAAGGCGSLGQPPCTTTTAAPVGDVACCFGENPIADPQTTPCSCVNVGDDSSGADECSQLLSQPGGNRCVSPGLKTGFTCAQDPCTTTTTTAGPEGCCTDDSTILPCESLTEAECLAAHPTGWTWTEGGTCDGTECIV